MSKKEYNFINITYKEYGNDIDKLCKKILDSKFEVDFIYGFPRGGLPIAVHLSHFFNCKILYSLQECYQQTINNKKNILFVDDIIDTGETYINVMPYLLYSTYTKTSTLYFKPRASFRPNIFIRDFNNDDWIVMPWEKENETPNRKI